MPSAKAISAMTDFNGPNKHGEDYLYLSPNSDKKHFTQRNVTFYLKTVINRAETRTKEHVTDVNDRLYNRISSRMAAQERLLNELQNATAHIMYMLGETSRGGAFALSKKSSINDYPMLVRLGNEVTRDAEGHLHETIPGCFPFQLNSF